MSDPTNNATGDPTNHATGDPVGGRSDGPARGPVLAGAIRLPDGSRVRGRGLRRPLPGGPVPGFGLYLGSGRLRRRHEGGLHWPHAWVDWPDFLLPRDRDLAVREIGALYERARAGEAVEVACGGGVGRTGTVLACLAVLSGLDAADAVAWTRAHHHPRAVETPWQRRWVAAFPRG
ncbi:MAG: protein tyrosine phosphatase [Nonomuraea muscovyensis]|nr:protein tyrosine phosphatase [Nonomuraea muscovyensis]